MQLYSFQPLQINRQTDIWELWIHRNLKGHWDHTYRYLPNRVQFICCCNHLANAYQYLCQSRVWSHRYRSLERIFLPSSSDIGTRSFSLLGAGLSYLLPAFATIASLLITKVDIGMLLSGELFGAVVAVLRGVGAGGNFYVFSVLEECARMTESIMKSKAARTTSRTKFVSDASWELFLTVVVRFTDVKDVLTPHCNRASSDTMVFILLCKVPVKIFCDL